MGPALKELIVDVGGMGENGGIYGYSPMLWVCSKHPQSRPRYGERQVSGKASQSGGPAELQKADKRWPGEEVRKRTFRQREGL